MPAIILIFYAYTTYLLVWVNRPPVFDFQAFWVAARFALEGRAADAYAGDLHAAAELRIHGREEGKTGGFAYPPFFLLACIPLGLLPYGSAASVWVLGTFGAYVAALRLIVPSWGMLVVLAAFPAVYWNLIYGQNGFLTAALFAVVVRTLGQRPVLAGLCIGLLAYKPHLGVVIPVALAIGGHWIAFGTATLVVLGTSAAATVAFGPEIWAAFLDMAGEASGRLNFPESYLRQMASVFATALLLGAGQAAAYAAQLAVAVLSVAILVVLIRRRPGASAEGAAIVCCTSLCTPYLLRYDMVILAIPLAWLWVQARRTGYLGGEKLIMVAAFAVVAKATIQFNEHELLLAPFACVVVFGALARRIMVMTAASGRGSPVGPDAVCREVR